jgi:hypothetical protein
MSPHLNQTDCNQPQNGPPRGLLFLIVQLEETWETVPFQGIAFFIVPLARREQLI